MRSLASIGLFAFLLLFARGVAAQDLPDVAADHGLRAEVHAGFGPGIAKQLGLCPVQVILALDRGPPLRGVLSLEVWPLAEDAPRCVHDVVAVELNAGSIKRVALSFRADGARGVRLVLRDEEGRIHWRRALRYGAPPMGQLQLLPPQVPLYATLGGPEAWLHWPPSLAAARVRLEEIEGLRPAAVRLTSGELTSGALDGLDALIVPDAPSLGPAEVAALERYVRAGGKLLCAAGRDGPRWKRDLLARLLPVTPGALVPCEGALGELHTDLLALAEADAAHVDTSSLLGEDEPLPLLSGRPRPGAEVLAAAGERPLLSVVRRGKGRVAFLGLPLDHPRLLANEGLRARVLQAALALALKTDPALDGIAMDALEAQALTGLIEDALEDASVRWIPLLILALVLVVGPLDYLFWRRFPGHRRTWLVLGLVATAFSVAAFTLGRAGAESGLRARGAFLIEPAEALASGAQGQVIEGLLVVTATRYDRHRIAPPDGLRLRLAAADPMDPFDSRRVPSWMFTSEAVRAEIGVSAALPLRVGGVLPGASFPVEAAWEADGALRVRNRGARPLKFQILRPERGVHFELAPGGERRVAPAEGNPNLLELSFAMLERNLVVSWNGNMHGRASSTASHDLLRASLQRAALERNNERWGGNGAPPILLGQLGARAGLPARIDASDALAAGQTLVLAVADGVDLAFGTRTGPLPLEATALYRLILDTPPAVVEAAAAEVPPAPGDAASVDAPSATPEPVEEDR